ncbi:MAG: hypothetical protein GTO63_12815 [Anaerolineae bacterium]|nr:hypothetical protein [Anaerolineae bacterium]NIN99821.1 hypothetical protein [Anaerolineae bacterium]NIQ78697.1 hypothetical protein [Anaerolineae bacterium]
MLSLELIAMFGLLLAFVVYVMVVTQLERRSIRLAEKKAEVQEAQERGELAEERVKVRR